MSKHNLPSRPWALITGASSGIGRSLALLCAEKNWNLVLIGQNIKALEEVARSCENRNAEVRFISLNLEEGLAPKRIYDFCHSEQLVIELLVNNAGFGELNFFQHTSEENINRMLTVNIKTLIHLSRLFLVDFLKAKKGNILHVGSVYSYVPVPGQALYAATKAFVKSFSLGLALEVEKQGVYVGCVCPGYTQTQFHERAGVLISSKKFSLTPEESAEEIYKGFLKKKKIIIPGWYNRFFLSFLSYLPELISARMVFAIVSRLRKKKL